MNSSEVSMIFPGMVFTLCIGNSRNSKNGYGSRFCDILGHDIVYQSFGAIPICSALSNTSFGTLDPSIMGKHVYLSLVRSIVRDDVILLVLYGENFYELVNDFFKLSVDTLYYL